MIPVTKPFLPPTELYNRYIEGIWKRQWLTNNGPLVNELELKLKRYLKVNHLLFTGNGTIALQIAIKALKLQGDIITTPFSYVATTSSIVWESCKPVFVDVDELTLNIDPNKIEEAITEKTTAILATHCFGNSCDIDRIKELADKYALKVIFDAAHCFGTTYNGRSIFEYGDVSAASFHATKVFHTVEGGAVFTNEPELLKRMSYMRNFGHDGPERFNGIGINGKNSEFHAAMGLCLLKDIASILSRRREQFLYYRQILKNLDVQVPIVHPLCEPNYSYYPIIFANEEKVLKAKNALESREIFPRRYFYPTLSSLDYVKKMGLTPVADSVASRILCLPIYHELSAEEQDLVARLLLRAQNY